ncbi:hypothetical protein D9615_004535 [Tricholomella constricta]|uniref:Uncharacterized protein n=1 Tax=Tricholomella constricta TaxID=117010 RepID=A0A8H5M4M7_9AGAR|nr:hypothetical protein D9615_004535 [Tricholomella constricta]
MRRHIILDTTRGGSVEHVKHIAKERGSDPLVLLSHIPLAREVYNCGPLREKGTIRPGMGFGCQNTLGKEVMNFLLEELQPSVIFSGDDHDYCETTHSNGIDSSARSPSSLSMAMGIKRSGFQLLSLAAQGHTNAVMKIQKTYADVPCVLPDQISIYLSAYIPLLLVSLLVALVSNAFRVRSGRFKQQRRRRKLSIPSRPHTTLRLRKTGDSSEEEPLNIARLPFFPNLRPFLQRSSG